MPPPPGIRTAKEVKMGSGNKMERFLNMLDDYLLSQKSRLQDVFNEFDLDGSGELDRRELARMIQRLMPELNPT